MVQGGLGDTKNMFVTFSLFPFFVDDSFGSVFRFGLHRRPPFHRIVHIDYTVTQTETFVKRIPPLSFTLYALRKHGGKPKPKGNRYQGHATPIEQSGSTPHSLSKFHSKGLRKSGQGG